MCDQFDVVFSDLKDRTQTQEIFQPVVHKEVVCKTCSKSCKTNCRLMHVPGFFLEKLEQKMKGQSKDMHGGFCLFNSKAK